MKAFIILVGMLFSLTAFAQKINFYITVDWEGVDFHSGILAQEDMKRVARFRERFPNYPMVHFLNAAYYTNGELPEDEVTRRIKSVVKAGDEIGVHLHPWENLIDHLGINFIDGPTYFDEQTSPFVGGGSPKYPNGHRGGDIPLWKYSVEDIRKMLRFSVQKLEEQGFEDIKSFRAGGWQAGPNVMEALRLEGFHSESSPVPFQKVANLYPETTLVDSVTKLWNQTTELSEPFVDRHGMMIFPNNAGLADYTDADEFMQVLQNNLKKYSHLDEVHIVFGYHLETAKEYMDRLDESIRRMEAFAKANGHQINPTTYRYERPNLMIKAKAVNSSNCVLQLYKLLKIR